MTKTELRKKIKTMAFSLTEEYKKEASRIITQRITECDDFRHASSVFVYVSMKNEPATDKIIETALSLGKRVYVPLCIGKGIMKAVRIDADTVFTEGYMGIREPEAEKYDTAEVFDMAVIPCVSASHDGRRLGHGAGFYDIFLSGKSIKTYCLCFGKLLCEEIPAEAHDIKVYTVSENL